MFKSILSVTHGRQWFGFGLAALALVLTSPVAQASLIISFDAPAAVRAAEPFEVGIYLDGIDTLASPFGPDELLAFGFRLEGEPALNSGPGGFAFRGRRMGLQFEDDSASVFPGDAQAVAGSAFPGAMGGHLLLATVTLAAHGDQRETSLWLGFDLGFMQSDPNSGIFTLVSSGLLDPFETQTLIRVAVPDSRAVGPLLAFSLAMLLWVRLLQRGRPRFQA